MKSIIGHILRVALRWTSHRKKKKGRPKDTRRKKVEKDIKAMGLKRSEAKIAVLDKICRRERVEVSRSA